MANITLAPLFFLQVWQDGDGRGKRQNYRKTIHKSISEPTQLRNDCSPIQEACAITEVSQAGMEGQTSLNRNQLTVEAEEADYSFGTKEIRCICEI